MAKRTESTGAAGTGEAASRLIITEIIPEQNQETRAKGRKPASRSKAPAAKPKKAAEKPETTEPRVESPALEVPPVEASRVEAPALEIRPVEAEPPAVAPKPAAAKKQKPAATAPKPKTRKIKVKIKDETGETLEVPAPVGEPLADPLGDVSDGEAHSLLSAEAAPEPSPEMAAYKADVAEDALEGTLEAHHSAVEAAASSEAAIGEEEDEDADEAEADEAEIDEPGAPIKGKAGKTGPPAKLERLQKILSKAGVASRRSAEAMIEAGRVMVNGTVVTQLGTKADAGRDHIRVDGKMLEGAEIHRYYVLNKPRGFVTTVSDPEGRPTVMQFFEKMRERLYPVGRLDYMTEGLLVVTNDGDLANKLTKASSGVEKTYLVKVAGQPTEEELDLLRGGVQIERGKPGSGMVKTSPAQVRQVRQGDNPWYEVILIEGRNRELRKMFEQIGHFVEKIRRVGYGPLVLDLEPGKLRELDPEEVAKLRLAADGKLKARRIKASKLLPREAGRVVEQRGGDRPPAQRSDVRPPRATGAWTPKTGGASARPFRAGEGGRPPRTEGGRGEKPAWKPRDPRSGGGGEVRSGGRPPFGRAQGGRPGSRFERPQQSQRFGAKSGFERPQGERLGGRSAFGAPEGERPESEPRRFGPRPGSERPFRGRPDSDSGPKTRFEGSGSSFKPQQREQEPRFEGAPRKTWDKPGERPTFKRPDGPKRFDKPGGKSFSKPGGRSFDRPAGKSFDRPAGKSFDRPAGRNFDRPAGGGIAKGPGKSFDRPAARFDKAPGKTWDKGPREGAPDRTSDRTGPRPSRPSGSTPAFRGKPASGGRSKPAFGSKPGGFKPKSGGFKSRPGSGSKPGGFKRSGPRPGGSRPGGRKRS